MLDVKSGTKTFATSSSHLKQQHSFNPRLYPICNRTSSYSGCGGAQKCFLLSVESPASTSFPSSNTELLHGTVATKTASGPLVTTAHGGSFDPTRGNGTSALHAACRKGSRKVAQFLLTSRCGAVGRKVAGSRKGRSRLDGAGDAEESAQFKCIIYLVLFCPVLSCPIHPSIIRPSVRPSLHPSIDRSIYLSI